MTMGALMMGNLLQAPCFLVTADGANNSQGSESCSRQVEGGMHFTRRTSSSAMRFMEAEFPCWIGELTGQWPCLRNTTIFEALCHSMSFLCSGTLVSKLQLSSPKKSRGDVLEGFAGI